MTFNLLSTSWEPCPFALALLISLLTYLFRFSVPKKLGDTLAKLDAVRQKVFVDVVTWLLKRDLLIQLHTYVFLVLPDHVAPERRKFPKHFHRINDECFNEVVQERFIDPFDPPEAPPEVPLSPIPERPGFDKERVIVEHRRALSSPVNVPGADKDAALKTSNEVPIGKAPSSPMHMSSPPAPTSTSGNNPSSTNNSINIPLPNPSDKPAPTPQPAEEVYYLSPEPLTDPELEFLKQLNDSSASYRLFLRYPFSHLSLRI